MNISRINELHLLKEGGKVKFEAVLYVYRASKQLQFLKTISIRVDMEVEVTYRKLMPAIVLLSLMEDSLYPLVGGDSLVDQIIQHLSSRFPARSSPITDIRIELSS